MTIIVLVSSAYEMMLMMMMWTADEVMKVSHPRSKWTNQKVEMDLWESNPDLCDKWGQSRLSSWTNRANRSAKSNSRTWSRLRVVPHFSSEIVKKAKRERAWKSPHATKARRGRESLTAASRLSRVSWFSRALAFRSFYYPWGKMGDYS